jgi:hypothetical protein
VEHRGNNPNKIIDSNAAQEYSALVFGTKQAEERKQTQPMKKYVTVTKRNTTTPN